MPTYTVRYKEYNCPSCGRAMKSDLPRFGPSLATCLRCKTTFQTGLSPWQSLSFGEKLQAAIAEIIAPSFFGSFFKALLINLVITSLWGMCGMSLVISTNRLATPGQVEIGVILGLLIWPAFLVVRLITMVLASYRYSNQGVPPVW